MNNLGTRSVPDHILNNVKCFRDENTKSIGSWEVERLNLYILFEFLKKFTDLPSVAFDLINHEELLRAHIGRGFAELDMFHCH